jgi:hypothetical protein
MEILSESNYTYILDYVVEQSVVPPFLSRLKKQVLKTSVIRYSELSSDTVLSKVNQGPMLNKHISFSLLHPF